MRRWWIAALVLAGLGLGLIAAGLQTHRHPLPGPRPAPAVALGAPAATPPGVAPPPVGALAASVPVALTIPAIDVSTSLSELGLTAEGTPQVPTDFQEPGWYRLGPTPGQLGSSVILGHVDSYQGPAVFFRLRDLVAGDQVDVTLADGVVAHFGVATVVMYPKTAFPDRQVYGPHGFSALQLVTCGGTFDASTGHYLSNVVVYTYLEGSTPPS